MKHSLISLFLACLFPIVCQGQQEFDFFINDKNMTILSSGDHDYVVFDVPGTSAEQIQQRLKTIAETSKIDPDYYRRPEFQLNQNSIKMSWKAVPFTVWLEFRLGLELDFKDERMRIKSPELSLYDIKQNTSYSVQEFVNQFKTKDRDPVRKVLSEEIKKTLNYFQKIIANGYPIIDSPEILASCPGDSDIVFEMHNDGTFSTPLGFSSVKIPVNGMTKLQIQDYMINMMHQGSYGPYEFVKKDYIKGTHVYDYKFNSRTFLIKDRGPLLSDYCRMTIQVLYDIEDQAIVVHAPKIVYGEHRLFKDDKTIYTTSGPANFVSYFGISDRKTLEFLPKSAPHVNDVNSICNRMVFYPVILLIRAKESTDADKDW